MAAARCFTLIASLRAAAHVADSFARLPLRSA